ncbi:hypothetical protein AX14_012101 [Amanita brunnescens Koide BX004]|nr:hypothetical protein AX14_012101 [Amanita brunnescens Koide BX004]
MHRSPTMGEDICVQTGNINAFINLPVGIEVFVKDRWAGLKSIEGAAQFERMPPPSVATN